jgi:hypothetical protein
MSDSRLRVHMGCGESLQSRRWIPRPVEAQPVSERDGKSRCMRTRTANVRRGTRFRS